MGLRRQAIAIAGADKMRFDAESMKSWVSLFFYPAEFILVVAGPERQRTKPGKRPLPDSDPFSDAGLRKIAAACQTNSPQVRMAASRFRKTQSAFRRHAQ